MSTNSSLKFRQDLCKHCLKKTQWYTVKRKCTLILTSLALQVYKSAFDEPSYRLYFESDPQQTVLGVPPLHYRNSYIWPYIAVIICAYMHMLIHVYKFICTHPHTHTQMYTWTYVIVKSHYEEVIIVITRVRGGAKDECNNNDNLRVQWDLTGSIPLYLMCVTLRNKWLLITGR